MPALVCHLPWRLALEKNTSKSSYSQKQPLGVMGCVTQQFVPAHSRYSNLFCSKTLSSLSWLTRMRPCLLSSIWHRPDEVCVLRTPSFNCPLLITQILLSATQSDSAAFSGKGNYILASVLFTARTRLLILLYLTKLLKTCKEKIDFQYGLFFVLIGTLKIMKSTVPVPNIPQLFCGDSHRKGIRK